MTAIKFSSWIPLPAYNPSLFIRAFSYSPSSAGYRSAFAIVPFSFASDQTMLSPAGTTFGFAENTGSANASSASIGCHPFDLNISIKSPRKSPLRRLKCTNTVCFTGRPSTRRHVFHVEVAIRLHVGGGVFFQTGGEPVVDRPVGIIDRDVTGSITVLGEKRSHHIALCRGIAFLEQREAEVFAKPEKVLQESFGAQDILLILGDHSG